jgi:RimJ/RimL family protein N-acetyltransferase
MRLVLDESPEVAAWVAARIPQMSGAEDFGPCRAIGVVTERHEPLGGVVFHNYQAGFRNIEVSFAADGRRWLTRNLIKGILAYPFEQLGCQRVTTLTPKRNREARKFLDTFGFKREGVVRRGFGNDDMIVSGLLKREWLRSKWMAPRLTQSLSVADAALDCEA